MGLIHPSALIDPQAQLGTDVEIGAFCIVEAGAVIGDGCILEPHSMVTGRVTMGARNVVGFGAVIGGAPQDKKFKGEPTFVQIGDENIFREYVTIHAATGEGNSTIVGDRNFLMAYSHLGHNVTLHNDITMANSVGVAGHVTIEDLANIGGMAGVHQYCRIGKVAMVAGMTRVVRDVPPFMIVQGDNQDVHDINAVGLRRIGITPDARLSLHKACKLLYKSQLGLRNAIEIVQREVPECEQVSYLLAFEERRYGGKNGRGDQR